LSKDCNIITSKKYDTRLAMWADYIWAEWANDDAYLASKNHPKKTVIRMHGYEAYTLGKLWNQIKWNDVKKVVFVAKHIQERMIEKVPSIKKENTEVIFNGVDLNKFYIKTKNRDLKNIGYAGYINVKKNPSLLLQIIRKNPDLNFHLRAEHQDAFIQAQFEYELRDCKNVVWHARYKDLNDFWNQMNIVLSTSIIESFSYNIAEAMACGCRPYIYNWNGAADFYPKKHIFDMFPKFDTNVSDKSRLEYREHIVKNYNNTEQLQKMAEVLLG
jgi:glycosyltransferase involved in cell wall biosynthesis